MRVAIQQIITSGQRYSGVFGQVKLVHEFVLENTNFNKKQIRSGQQLRTFTKRFLQRSLV